MTEEYYYGQGKVEIAEINAGVVGEFVWIGDVSSLSGALSEESFAHSESYSGDKAEVRKLFLGKTWEWSATMLQLDTENIARFTQGTITSVNTGTATAEDLGTIAAGDSIDLAHVNVSSLVITDSAGSPATIAASHYEYDEFGTVVFKTLPTSPAPTMPLKAAYSYGASEQVAFLNAPRKNYALRYKGVNLAEEGQKVLVELYKVAPGLLQTLALITDGNQLASAPITMTALKDTSKPNAGSLGQYGRLVTFN